MDTVISPEWRAVNPRANKRDVLVALALIGPATGTEIHERVREDPDASTLPVTHATLRELADAGYVVQREGEDARTKNNRLSSAGWDLIEAGVMEPARRINDA
jgi:hypothetical protein